MKIYYLYKIVGPGEFSIETVDRDILLNLRVKWLRSRILCEDSHQDRGRK